MQNFTRENILKATKGIILQKGRLREYQSISIDSRTIKPGELFLCLKGENFDGHDFVPEAIKRGAGGIIAQRKIIVGPEISLIKVNDTLQALKNLAKDLRKKNKIPLIAITGSNGKTTTKEMAAKILAQKYNLLKSQGNFNNLIGVSLTLLKLKPLHQIGILEIGMNRRREIKELCKVAQPQLGIITNIGEAHLEFLGSKEGVAEAKGELLDYLSHPLLKSKKLMKPTAVLNADDPYLLNLAQRIKRRSNAPRIIYYGVNSKKAEVRARKIRNRGLKGNSFLLELNKKQLQINLSLLGIHNIYNALAAAAAALTMGIELEKIKKGLSSFQPLSMRLEKKKLESGTILINDSYNANPASMQSALKILAKFKSRKTWLIIGDMLELGEKAKEAHQNLGKEIARTGINYLISLGELSRLTALTAIKEGISAQNVYICRQQREVVDILQAGLKKNMLALFKGSRRMGLEKIIAKLFLNPE